MNDEPDFRVKFNFDYLDNLLEIILGLTTRWCHGVSSKGKNSTTIQVTQMMKMYIKCF